MGGFLEGDKNNEMVGMERDRYSTRGLNRPVFHPVSFLGNTDIGVIPLHTYWVTEPHLLYHLHLEETTASAIANQATLWTNHRNMTGSKHNLGAEKQTTKCFVHVIIWNREPEKWKQEFLFVLGEL